MAQDFCRLLFILNFLRGHFISTLTLNIETSFEYQHKIQETKDGRGRKEDQSVSETFEREDVFSNTSSYFPSKQNIEEKKSLFSHFCLLPFNFLQQTAVIGQTVFTPTTMTQAGHLAFVNLFRSIEITETDAPWLFKGLPSERFSTAYAMVGVKQTASHLLCQLNIIKYENERISQVRSKIMAKQSMSYLQPCKANSFKLAL